MGVLGATGAVGQRLVSLLDDHPWFELVSVMASPRSAGQPYGEAVDWQLPGGIPAAAAALRLGACEADGSLPLVLSALGSGPAAQLEPAFAAAGSMVVSNASAFRMAADVPLVIPEVNAGHLALLDTQERGPGAILTNPNCATIGLAIALAPLHRAFGVERVSVVTLQALSGAGLPGEPSLRALDNVLPFIDGEEQKLETETARLLGTLVDGAVVPAGLRVSAQCNRVPVSDGHMLCVSVGLAEPADHDAVRAAWLAWRAPDDVTRLPSAPARALHVLEGPDVPQPRLHRNLEGGMAVSVGRLRACPLLHHRFVALVHNTLRGAAGGALLLAELAVVRGYVPEADVLELT